MEIRGKVHCLFEQSGTFKKEFKKLGYKAYDYDIQNNFGETDHVIDLFEQIDIAYEQNRTEQNRTEQNRTEQNRTEQRVTIFDTMSSDDLIIAFYPCIYFCAMSQVAFNLNYRNYQKLTFQQKIEKILQRSDNRKEYYDRLIKLVAVCMNRNLRMVFENPWNEQTYLKSNFLKKPDVVDTNRMERGDYYRKPTAYWFWNCEPTNGFTHQNDKEKKIILQSKKASKAGMCSEERSLISSDYVRNWICDFILGKEQHIEGQYNQLSLF